MWKAALPSSVENFALEEEPVVNRLLFCIYILEDRVNSQIMSKIKQTRCAIWKPIYPHTIMWVKYIGRSKL